MPISFHSLVLRNTWDDIKLTILANYPKEEKRIGTYLQVWEDLQKMITVDSDIVIRLTEQKEDDETFVDVDGYRLSSSGECHDLTLDFVRWNEWLGMKVDFNTLNQFSEPQIIAHCLFEMTLVDFSEIDIQSKKNVQNPPKNTLQAGRQREKIMKGEKLSMENLGINQPKLNLLDFQLQFVVEDVQDYASRYKISKEEKAVFDQMDQIKKRGFLSKNELDRIVRLKSPERITEVHDNRAVHVQEITNIALTTDNEQLRMEVLHTLKGMDWPIASTILHLYHRQRFAILDEDALLAVSCHDLPLETFNFEGWKRFNDYARILSSQARVDMPTLSRSFHQFAREKQAS